MEKPQFEKQIQKYIKLNKEEKIILGLKGKYESELKNTKNIMKQKSHKSKKEIFYSYIFPFINIIYIYLLNRRKEKNRLIKDDDKEKIKLNLNEILFLEYKNKFLSNLKSKRKKINIKKYYKKKRNIVKIKNNPYMIIIMIFFNLILPNTNNIEYHYSEIILKIHGPGFQNILSSSFGSSYFPKRIYINGIENTNINYTYYFNEINNTVKLTWDNAINYCSGMFRDCANITEIDLSKFDTSQVISMSFMFYNCSQLTSLDLSNFKTSNVTSMSYMFYYCPQLISLDVSKFNTSKVTSMYYMFYYCRQLTSLDVSNFDTTNVKNMGSMFSQCYQLFSLNLTKFDTSKVTYMYNMFNYCSQLSSLDVSNFDTSNVTNMGYMFSYCYQLSSLSLSNFDTSNVTNMGGMFSGCSKFTSFDLSNFDTSKVTNMYSMFSGCSQLSSLNLSNFDTSNVTNMGYMFNGCSQLSSLNLSNFNTSNVTNMGGMFSGCSKFTSLDLSNFDTSNTTNMYSMFSGCSQLKSLDLSNFNTSKVKSMGWMFDGCTEFTSLDLSYFDTSQVTNIGGMFYDCPQLTSLDLSNFNTSKVRDMGWMFAYCDQLPSLNLSNFDTSQVTNMGNMFYYSIQLTSIDVSNFDTINVKNMGYMFGGCYQLSSLNLSNFNTSNVIDMGYMFSHCFELFSLDLSNFDTSKVTIMDYMFNSCRNLEYINFKNLTENNNLSITNVFKNIPDNIVLCLNNNITKLLQEMSNKDCYPSDCSNQCLDISNNDIFFYKFEYYGPYYDNCINEDLTNNKAYQHCQCKNETCSKCSDIILVDNLYEKEDEDNSKGYINCYKDPIGYYLDLNISKYKKCFNSCEKCEIEGNNNTHNCLECKNSYPIEFKVNYYYNCYENCIYYHYFDNLNNYYYCTINGSCPIEYPILDKLECQKNKEIKDLMEELINNITKENETKYYDTILENIEEIFTSEDYNTFNLDSGNDEILETEKVKVILTTTENQKNNLNNNMTNIELGKCEDSLRQTYNLSNGSSIYIKMIEIIQEGMRIPKIEYDIYSKNDEGNLIRLNLTSCKNNKISLSIPVHNVGNIDILNSSSGYYNDFCYTATSDSGTDITLKDRKNEYTSKAVCQDDCDFVDYNFTLKKAKCSCEAKGSSESFADMKINRKKLLDNLKDLKNLGNFNILKCYKVLFSKKGLSNNFGFLIIIAITIFHIISIFIFYLKQFELLKTKIKDIALAKNLNLKPSDKKKEESIKEIIGEKKDNGIENFKKKASIINNYIIVNDNISNINSEKIEEDKIINFKKKGKIVTKKKKIKVLKKQTGININNNYDNINNDEGNSDVIIINQRNGVNILSRKHIKTNEVKKLASVIDYNDDEMNDLPYDLALLNDKRSYWKFYVSLIKTRHEFFYAFCYNKDHNSRIIKFDLFLIGFALNYTVDGFFFNDQTMHNVYESKGLFDIDYQLPIIIYSSFISMFLGALLQKLGLSADEISDFKQSKETNNINENGQKLILKLKIKFVFYFILGFIFLLFFLYYISMFCAIYRNTQFLLLEDTAMGFGLSLFTPFVIYSLPGLFRIPSLANPQKRRKCLYNFSKLFTIL